MKQILLAITLSFLVSATAFGMTDKGDDKKNVAAATEGVAALRLQRRKFEKAYAALFPLHVAARAGNYAECKKLLEAKSPVDLLDENNATPLHCAAFFNYPNICKLLIKAKANIEITDSLGYTPLRVAYEATTDQASLMVLIEHGAKTEELEGLGKLTIKVIPEETDRRYEIHFLQEFSYDQVPVEKTYFEKFDEKDSDGEMIPRRLAICVYQRASVDIQAMIQEMLKAVLKGAVGFGDERVAAIAAKAAKDLVAAKEYFDRVDNCKLPKKEPWWKLAQKEQGKA